MNSAGFGIGVRGWLSRIVLALSAAAMGTACAPVTAARGRFECVVAHGGSPSNGNMGAFDDVCAPAVSSARLLSSMAVAFLMIVLMESVIVRLPRRFPCARWTSGIVGTGWTPFLMYGLGVWFAHGLASGLWFDAGNSWLLMAETMAGANAVAIWDIGGMRTLPYDRDVGVVTLASRVGIDAAKRNVILFDAGIVVLTAIQFGDLGLVIAGTAVPLLVPWIAILSGALFSSVMLRRADSPYGYDVAMIAQHVLLLLCAAVLAAACWSDSSRIAGLMQP